MMELTVPWEDWIEEGRERNEAKYLELAEECRSGRPVVSPLRWVAGALQGSLCIRHSVSWASEGCRKEEPPKTSLKLQKKRRAVDQEG